MRALQRGVFRARHFADPKLVQDLFGVRFENPLGLAAGFDKNAVALDHWSSLGFGFVECGTVTLHPQQGNQRPRLFRLPEDQALINRMGFNNDGAKVVGERLASTKSSLPVGINLGKSKITELEHAAEDYAGSFRLLHRYGAYAVVNVSSPNTPGLRDLQEKRKLTEIVGALQSIDPTRPIFVKISPDLSWSAIDELVSVVEESDLCGLIATNTSVSRDALKSRSEELGGLSGKPLATRSSDILRYLYRQCSKRRILIGVGGIFNGDDLHLKIALGAHLCQVYTGWVYGGPQMVPDSLERLTHLMARDGVNDLSELRGSQAN